MEKRPKQPTKIAVQARRRRSKTVKEKYSHVYNNNIRYLWQSLTIACIETIISMESQKVTKAVNVRLTNWINYFACKRKTLILFLELGW